MLKLRSTGYLFMRALYVQLLGSWGVDRGGRWGWEELNSLLNLKTKQIMCSIVYTLQTAVVSRHDAAQTISVFSIFSSVTERTSALKARTKSVVSWQIVNSTKCPFVYVTA